MKIKIILFILALGLLINACKKDDTVPFNPEEQAVIDNDSIVKYLETHYLDVDTLKVIDAGQTPLMDQVDIENIVYNDIAYKLYYLVQNEGVGVAPTRLDSVLTTYRGTLLDGYVIDERKSLTWMSLTSVIPGWSYGFPHYKSGTKVVNTDESFYFEDYGQGFLFIPSGLAYRNSGYGSVPPNAPLIFQITCQDVNKTDSDNDGVSNFNEDLNHNYDLTDDDTDGDSIPNAYDMDDDGDGILTINEDTNGDGNWLNDDADADGIPDYLDPDII